MRVELKAFEPIYQEIHYQMTSIKQDGNCYINSPDLVMKISPLTITDRLEYLTSRKKFDEVFQLIEQAKAKIPKEEVVKV